jgi:hypothetical protein
MIFIRTLAVVLMALVCAGCGSDPKPPAAAPPKFVPAADAMAERHEAEKSKSGSRRPEAAAEPADEAEKPNAGDEAVGRAGSKETKDDEVPSPELASDDKPSDAGVARQDGAPDEKPTASKSGKWMRGLANSLNRALSKSLDKASQAKPAKEKPPAPEDDPFPNGEPEE